MNFQPYSAPLSFYYPTAPPLPDSSSTTQPIFPHQHTASTPRVRRQQGEEWHANTANTQSTIARDWIPSTEHTAAVASLRGIDIPTILKWLERLRSSLHGEASFNLDQPPPQHYQALSTLIACPNELVQIWLNVARSPRTFTPLQDLEANKIYGDGSATADSISQPHSSFDITPGTPWEQESYNPSRDASVGVQSSSATTSNDHHRWCFICEHSRPITTHDGLRRHVQTHSTKYYCIPPNSIRHTNDGPICAFCDVSDPDPRHLNTHNRRECISRSFTRKENLTKHLRKEHRIRNPSVLAKQAKYIIDQKYFACGFCVFCCDSLNGLINHVDALHYKRSAHRSQWNQNIVIWGLLLQPLVCERWQGLLVANPYLQEPGLKWNPTHIKDLQRRLELSQEPAAVLCQAAQAVIDEHSHGTNQQDLVESAPLTGFKDHNRDASRSIQTFHREDSWFPPAHASKQGPLSYASSRTVPIPSHNLGMRALNDSEQETNIKDAPSPDVGSERYALPSSSGYHPATRYAQPWASPNVMRYQSSTSISSLASASGTSWATEGQTPISHSSDSTGYPGRSPNVFEHPCPRQEVLTHSYPAQGQMGLAQSTLTTQSTSSPLSRNREARSLGRLNRGYSATPHSSLTAQFSRKEKTDHHGMVMSHGSSSPQGFIQDQHSSKRQRRKR